jgi:nitrogen fixation regulatory protein
MDTKDCSPEIEQHLSNLKLLAEDSPDHIVVTDIEGIIVYANPSVEKITGFKNTEIMGFKAGKLWGGIMPREFYEDMWKIIKTDKKVYISELSNRSKSGKIYKAHITIVPILDNNGNICYFLGTERVTD